VPTLPPEDKEACAVLIADIHLCLKPPTFRSKEDDWLAVQAGYLNQVEKLTFIECSSSISRQLPVICAGDIFHRWNAPAELINFALQHLPHMYAIPGQHDLPHHNYDDIRKSAYWTLVKAGKIINLTPDKLMTINLSSPIRVHAFPWGFPVKPLKNPHDMMIELCVSHSFIWTEKTGYPGAPPEQRLKTYKKKLRGYDVALFGDNHKPVNFNLSKTTDTVAIFNPGSVLCMNVDQIDHRPRVGILYNDGTVILYYLDISKDVIWKKVESCAPDTVRLEELVELLNHIPEQTADFAGDINRAMDYMRVSTQVRSYVLECLE
jgi:DNA repair exonuclease SbcCD nuclease subunit